jgi:DNA-binding GntR family transcriptional regulator
VQGASPPHETGRAETVYRDIHLAIVEHRLSPGTRLPEAHLAHVFGVSRTLVRQALQHLAHDHLVVLEPNRGARIAEPSIDEVRQLYEVRRLIECNMLAEGASRITGRPRLSARWRARRMPTPAATHSRRCNWRAPFISTSPKRSAIRSWSISSASS